MKPRQSSRGCKSCPAKGAPTRVGSQPCDGAGDGSGDASAGEHLGCVRAAGQRGRSDRRIVDTRIGAARFDERDEGDAIDRVEALVRELGPLVVKR